MTQARPAKMTAARFARLHNEPIGALLTNYHSICLRSRALWTVSIMSRKAGAQPIAIISTSPLINAGFLPSLL